LAGEDVGGTGSAAHNDEYANEHSLGLGCVVKIAMLMRQMIHHYHCMALSICLWWSGWMRSGNAHTVHSTKRRQRIQMRRKRCKYKWMLETLNKPNTQKKESELTRD
jgi:hypothetical protein